MVDKIKKDNFVDDNYVQHQLLNHLQKIYISQFNG